MAVTGMRLVDGDLSLTLYPRDDVQILSLDVPAPDARAVVRMRPDDDGTTDTSARFGSRPVALELQVIERPAAFVDALTRYLHPARRPYLYLADDEWSAERRIKLRTETWSAPMTSAEAPFYRKILAQWRAPDGVWEAAEETQLIVGVDIPSSIGMSFPMAFPAVFAATTAGGAQQTTNTGSAPSHFKARLYGPITAPRLINASTEQEIVFTDSLVLGAGDYVEVDTRNRTAWLNSNVLISRLGHVDFFAPNEWWPLQGGVQRVRYTGTTPGAGARAVLYYRPAWL